MASHLGQRIATARRTRRMSQEALARAAHVSLSMLRKVEQGARVPGDDTLEAIAAALGMDPGRLLPGHDHSGSRMRDALPSISAAIAGYDINIGAPAPALDRLAAQVDEAMTYRLASQYSRLAAIAPGLLTDAIAALHASSGPSQQAVARLLASAARSADAVAYKAGGRDLSARLIDLMRWAATQAEDPLLDAVCSYVRAETFFAARAHAVGLRALETAIDSTPAGSPTATAARGALHMRAAVLAARDGNVDAAQLHIGEARTLGDTVTEDVYQGTAFGPESVRIHQVSLAVSLGGNHIADALTVAREWKPSVSLPAERRSGFYIELAVGQLDVGRADDAFESLKVARSIAPQHTRQHPWARETAGTLRRLKRADADSLTSYAEWIGAV
ncbi:MULTISPECIES: helix-turn-helix transcriptional regulator [unclassified Streptomyces]|uniref:helix-turn-helix domain-containing protein n=1 Tax=unclassified Streptomyces TaxID=2593676 RepID=UPI003321FEBC